MTQALWSAPRGASVLVTGAAGFVGRHLVARLRGLGASVTALLASTEKVPHDWMDPSGGPCPRVVVADVTDGPAVTEVVRACLPRRVFHLAALTDHSECLADVPRFLRVNVEGLALLLGACAALEAPPEGVVTLGSGEEYGVPASVPVYEDAPLCPFTPYGISKAAATAVCRAAWRFHRLPVVVLRPFMLYGPGQSSRFFLTQLLQATLEGKTLEMTSGRQTRDFLHVEDGVAGMLAASGAPSLFGEVANLCSGVETSLRDLCGLWQEVSGLEREIVVLDALPHRPGEIFRYVGSNQKLRAATSWAPCISIEEGLRRLLCSAASHEP